MTTRRTPIIRFPAAREIPPDAAAVFRDMESLPPCTCIWGPSYHDRQECASCEQWWKLHNKLYDALIWHKPWQWPLVEYLAIDDPPYDEIEGGHIHQRVTPRVHRAAEWDKDGSFFHALRAAAGRKVA
jgi:hypothetical protein